MCNAPHEPVEISVAGCAQIEVVYHGSQDPGVRLSQPLGVCLNGKFPGDVLVQETKQVNLFWGIFDCTANFGLSFHPPKTD